MRNFVNASVIFGKSEDGPTAVEYAIMLALIASSRRRVREPKTTSPPKLLQTK